MTATPCCPLCGKTPETLFLGSSALDDEISLRERFFRSRLRGRFSSHALRDVTEVFLGDPADILRCDRCGVLIRADAPGDESFRDDRYGPAVLESLHAAHAVAFREKSADYRALLPRGARVVEIGSYAGGFLRAASEWGWRATGVDIGSDTSRFTRALGFETHNALPFGSRSIDALFVWNCFEQLSTPRALLADAFRLLRDGGWLVRVPDAGLYAARRDARVLGYNGLLGWPHRFGFGVRSLRRLAGEHGFALQRVLRRPALRPLRESMAPWAQAEESALIREERCGWIELTFRQVSVFASAA
jgi:SAM-dependent methyltransferase